jgi:hypothetical protein
LVIEIEFEHRLSQPNHVATDSTEWLNTKRKPQFRWHQKAYLNCGFRVSCLTAGIPYKQPDKKIQQIESVWLFIVNAAVQSSPRLLPNCGIYLPSRQASSTSSLAGKLLSL